MAQEALIAEKLLGPNDPAPVGVRNGNSSSTFLLICDHAGNAVPGALKNLGLPKSELDRHIGYDIGILGVSEILSDMLNAPLVFQRYSRLVVECNRVETSPDSIALISDGTAVPGNASLSETARAMRHTEIAQPYHREIVSRLEERQSQGLPVVLLAMHSFTPSLLAKPSPRPWHVGLCYDAAASFSLQILKVLDKHIDIVIGRNEPYGVDMARDYSIPIHGEKRGIPYAEFEIRQDLIATVAGQKAWAERLVGVIREAYAELKRAKS
jgi:predicted N-formylglutamate amidohydrolase